MAISSRRDNGRFSLHSLGERIVGNGVPKRAEQRADARAAPQRLKERYSLVEVLGHGSLGTTYRAFDQTMQRGVAIKLASERYAYDSQFGQRFMAEVAAAGRLSHPNVAHVLDAGFLAGRPFVVMELVEGKSLRAILADGPLPTDQCAKIAQQLVDALEGAHHQGVVHGDLRPDNVLLDRRGDAKIADFGLVRAAVATDRTLLGSAIRRTPYIPPEQLPAGPADEQTDLYALGVLLYELLTGATPPAGLEALGGRAHSEVMPPRRVRADVPLELDRAVMRALDPNPTGRFASLGDFRRDLRPEPAGAGAARSEAPAVAAWRTAARPRPPRGSRGAGHHATALVPLLASLAIVLAAIGAFTVVFPRLFSNFQMIDVPTVVEYDLAEATSIAAAHGLEVRVVGTQPTDDRPKDTVLTQNPAVGARLRRGSELKIAVSSGMRPPNVVGKSIEEARAILFRAGWPIVGIEIVPDAEAAADTVVGTRPGPDGTVDDRKRGIAVLVSGGNLALRRPIVMSNGEAPPIEMVDGDPNTSAKIAVASPRWVEIELARPTTLAAVELVVSQGRPGDTVHEIWVRTASAEVRGMHTFAGQTSDNQTLSVRFGEAVRDVRAVRIATAEGVGGLGWREIRLFERAPAAPSS